MTDDYSSDEEHSIELEDKQFQHYLKAIKKAKTKEDVETALKKAKEDVDEEQEDQDDENDELNVLLKKVEEDEKNVEKSTKRQKKQSKKQDTNNKESENPENETREKKPSRRKRQRQNREKNEKKRLEELKKAAAEKQKQLSNQLIQTLCELKSLIKGDKSAIDKVEIKPDSTWDDIENNELVEEITNFMYDDEEEENDDEDQNIRELRKKLKILLEDYYTSHFEDLVLAEDGTAIKTRFKYKQVEKENYGLTTEQILEMDDDELDVMMNPKKKRNRMQKKTGKHEKYKKRPGNKVINKKGDNKNKKRKKNETQNVNKKRKHE